MSTPTRPAPSRRVLAVILSILNAGAGHVALGYPMRGVLWLAASFISTILCLAAILLSAPHPFWIIVVVVVSIRLSSIVVTVRSPLMDVSLGKAKAGILIVLMFVLMEFTSVLATTLIEAKRSPSESMYPGIWVGDHFYSSRKFLKLGRGDVILFEYPKDRSKLFSKRIVGVAGDTVQMIDGQLILNGVPVSRRLTDESCARNSRCKVWNETLDGKSYRVMRLFDTGGNAPDFGPTTITPGHVFVLGDNRDNSLDSRFWGALPVDLVKGNPLFVYWSSDESGIHWNRINQRIN